MAEIKQTAFSGEIEDAERTGHAQTLPLSRAKPIPFVNQQQVSAEEFR